jgi:tetratricopeptide (TPR) repeat protein
MNIDNYQTALPCVRPMIAAGHRALDEGNAAHALHVAEQRLAEAADDVEALELKGLALAELGELNQSADCYRKLRQLEPSETVWSLSLADCLLRGFPDDRQRVAEAGAALAAATKAIDGQPEIVNEVAFLQGLFFALSGQLTKAIDSFRRLLAHEPEHLEARLELGLALFETGQWQAAKGALLAVLEQDDQEALAHLTLGLIQERFGENPEEAFARAVAIDPQSHFLPSRVSADEWTALLDTSLAALGHPVSSSALVVERLPSEQSIRQGLSPSALGDVLFSHGAPSYVLFQRNIERQSRDVASLQAELTATIAALLEATQ